MGDISTKPYLIRAIHEWCTDCGYRPYIAVSVDEGTVVPREFVRGGEIVLNVSVAATNHLVIGNDAIEFEARFGGIARSVSIPIGNVSAIYAQETGHGMAFDVPKSLAQPAAVPRERSRDPGSVPVEPPAGPAGHGAPATGGRKRAQPTLVPVSPSVSDESGSGRPENRDAAAPGKPQRKPRAVSTRSRKASSPELVAKQPPNNDSSRDLPPDDPPPRPPAGRPSLTRVK
jgi:stringent starvation protein B